MQEEKGEPLLTLQPSSLAQVTPPATTAPKHGQVGDPGSPQAEHEQTTRPREKGPTKQLLQGGHWLVPRTF